MNFFTPFIALLFLLSGWAPAASLTNNEILAQLQTTLNTGEGFEDIVKNLEEMEGTDLENLLKEFNKTYPRLLEKYLRGYQEFAEEQFSGAAKNEARKLIKGHRDDFMRIYALAEGPMKPELKKVSMPAILALRKLILPTGDEVFATAPQSLQKQREIILTLAKFRDAIVNTAILPDEIAAEKTVLDTEKEIVSNLAGLPRDGLRIMAENDKIAAKDKVPVKEREGVREVNEWRLLLGLNALVLDPKLCDASRGHSEDMATVGFFAHESPVPGKKSPWDRASKAGTKASGENIYMGSENPAGANKGWFYSPGHHKNMFGAKHSRIGLGQYGRHWTQMFG
ncbi:CAP domain-containing protein [Verrucomicrobiaceae bacterium 227]